MRSVILIVMGASLSFSFITTDKKEKIYTIQELLKNSDFQITIKSNGEHSGESVVMDIKSIGIKDISLLIPEGTLFYPADENEQTLIVPREQLFVINKKQINNIVLNGFCTEMSDKIPISDGVFKIGTNTNEKLAKLLQFFKGNSRITIQNVQEAIWCITNNESISNIYCEDTTINSQLQKTLAEITGQEIPWHTNKREIETNNEGYIVATSVEVKGDVVFSTTKKTIIKSKVVNENGEVVFGNQKDMEIPKALKNIKLDFKVSVKGWEKGKYFVIYYTEEGNTILKKEFNV